MGHSWGTLRTLAQDRLRWREFVAALVVYDKKGSKQVNIIHLFKTDNSILSRARLKLVNLLH